MGWDGRDVPVPPRGPPWLAAGLGPKKTFNYRSFRLWRDTELCAVRQESGPRRYESIERSVLLSTCQAQIPQAAQRHWNAGKLVDIRKVPVLFLCNHCRVGNDSMRR